MFRQTRLRLPTRSRMVAIDSEDPLPYYYSRLTGWGYRKRLSMAVSLVGGQNYGSLLEIGYGSGIFLPELASHCQKLTAVDTHRKAALVSTMLASEGIEARLLTGDIRALPLPDECFDGVVCLSVLEHLLPHDLAHAVAEVRRVAKPRAVVVFGYPLRNVFTDSFFQLVRFAARDLHPSSHQDIQTAVAHGLSVERVVRFPMWLPEHLSWYVALRCTRND